MATYNDKPWLKGYKVGPFKIPTTMGEYPKVSLFQFFDETTQRYPSRPACLYLGRKITWKELRRYVDRLAGALNEMGVSKGDKVATILPTSPQFVISDYAILKCGATHVPCSLLHKETDLNYEIGASGAKVVICLDASLDLVKSVKEQTALETIIITALTDFSQNEKPMQPVAGAKHLRQLASEGESASPVVKIDPENDLALLAFTGGATGKPKGVMLTHFNLTSNTLQTLPWFMGPLQAGIKGKSSIMIALPTFHATGHSLVRSAVHWGLQMIMIPDPRDVNVIATMLKKHRPFMAPLVPTQYMNLIGKGIGRTNTSFTSGAAPLPAEVVKRFKKETGMPIAEAYGLTETGPLAHFNLSTFSKITGFMPFEKNGSIGVPVVDTEVKLINSNTGDVTPYGEVGEMYIKGPQVMKGYWPDPGAGLKEGWLPTGDLCRMDEDGYFYLVDRDKDMINVSGNKVYSTTVDDVLFEHPAVDTAITIGVPDPERPGSERVKVFVVLRQEYIGTVDEETIISYCKEKLAPYAVPKFVELKKSLPYTVTEKLFKKQLRDEEIKKYQNV